MMEDDELVQTAKDFAEQQGRLPEEYLVTSIQKESECTWVFFQGVSGRPGDHFSVCLDNQSGKALRLVPGR